MKTYDRLLNLLLLPYKEKLAKQWGGGGQGKNF